MSDAVPEVLHVEVSHPTGGVVLVVLAGELDLVSVGQLQSRIADVDLEESAHVVIDLAGLDFVDSTGINALLRSVRNIEARGATAALAAPSPVTRRVFEIARVSQLVHIEDDRKRALAWRPAPLGSASEADEES